MPRRARRLTPRALHARRRPQGERYTFRTQTVTLLSGCTLAPGERRSFRLQFALPPALPPSFRGTFARCGQPAALLY